jgi:hypothetical protein
MLGVPEILAPIRIVTPGQPLTREEHRQESVRVLDELTSVAIKRVLLPACAGSALVEHALVFVDEEDETLLRMFEEKPVEVLRQHPRQQLGQFVRLFQPAVAVEFLEFIARLLEISCLCLSNRPTACVRERSHTRKRAGYFAGEFAGGCADKASDGLVQQKFKLDWRFVSGRFSDRCDPS